MKQNEETVVVNIKKSVGSGNDYNWKIKNIINESVKLYVDKLTSIKQVYWKY